VQLNILGPRSEEISIMMRPKTLKWHENTVGIEITEKEWVVVLPGFFLECLRRTGGAAGMQDAHFLAVG